MPDPTDAHALPALVDAAAAGDSAAANRLFESLNHELHRMARRELHARAGGQTLGATTMLHETWLSLSRRGVEFPDRGRFFAYAARAMRGLIIDQIRARRAVKRGGAFHFTEWDTEGVEGALPTGDADALGEALEALGQADPGLAELVDLRLFGPMPPTDSMPAVMMLQFEAREALVADRPAEARDGFGKVIDFFDSRGMQVAPVVSAPRSRAEAHRQLGALDAATADLERALVIARGVQGDKAYSSLVGRTLAGLQRVQAAQGRADLARRTAALAAASLERAIGTDHPDTHQARAAAAAP